MGLTSAGGRRPRPQLPRARTEAPRLPPSQEDNPRGIPGSAVGDALSAPCQIIAAGCVILGGERGAPRRGDAARLAARPGREGNGTLRFVAREL
eukprot:4771299-Pyramimonas_sp.AAC.1